MPISSSFKKVFRWLGLIFLLFLFLCVGLVGWAWLSREQLKSYMISALNSQLKAEISVSSVSINVWQHFPHVALDFRHVVVPGTGPSARGENVIEAERVYLKFHLWELLRGTYQLHRVEIMDARIHLRLMQGTRGNYDLFQPAESASEDAFSLKRVLFSRTLVLMEDSMASRKVDLTLNTASFSLNLSAEETNLSASWDGLMNAWEEKDWAIHYSLPHLAKADIVLRDGQLLLPDFRIETGSLVFVGEGAFGEKDHLKVRGDQLNLVSCISLLPERFRDFERELESKGMLDFQLTLDDGVVSSHFKLSGGSLMHLPTGVFFSELRFSGDLTHSSRGIRISISDIYALSDLSLITGRIGLVKEKAWDLDLDIRLKASAEELVAFLPNHSIGDLRGQLSGQIKYQGGLDPIPGLASGSGSGEIMISNLFWKNERMRLPIENLDGVLALEGGIVRADRLFFKIGQSDFLLQGRIPNFMRFILGSDTSLRVVGNLSSSFIDGYELSSVFKEEGADEAFSLPSYLDCGVALKIESLQYKKFTATGFRSDVSLGSSGFSVLNTVLQTCGGSVGADFRMSPSLDGFTIGLDSRITRLNIQTLFSVFNHFGMDILQSKHIEGTLNSLIKLSMTVGNDLSPNPYSVSAQIPLNIQQGRLNQYEPIRALGRFIKIDALEDIRFETLKNELYINNGVVHIPEMEIQSSALNLRLSGRHSFDNDLDYKINLLLREALAAKFKQRRSGDAFGEFEDEPGGTRLYLKMTGSAYAPKISYDLQSAGKKLSEDLKEEGKKIRQLLHDDFGLFRKDSTLIRKETRPEKKRRPERREDEFGFE